MNLIGSSVSRGRVFLAFLAAKGLQTCETCLVSGGRRSWGFAIFQLAVDSMKAHRNPSWAYIMIHVAIKGLEEQNIRFFQAKPCNSRNLRW